MGRMALTFCPASELRMAAAEAGGVVEVRGSMSARRGRAPARRIALTEAKKLKGLVITASVEGWRTGSREPIPAAARASQSASVPEAHPTACMELAGVVKNLAAAASKLVTAGPRINFWEM